MTERQGKLIPIASRVAFWLCVGAVLSLMVAWTISVVSAIRYPRWPIISPSLFHEESEGIRHIGGGTMGNDLMNFSIRAGQMRDMHNVSHEPEFTNMNEMLPAWCRRRLPDPYDTWWFYSESTGYPAKMLVLRQSGDSTMPGGPVQSSLYIPVDESRNIVLPLAFLPVGFALNAVSYALACAVPYYAARLAIRAWRRRVGRCPACGYDTRGLTACPECGSGSSATDCA
ncbi:MAG: hypothetical protein R3B57_04470 [Phycisphaerales bacterium]